MAVAAGVLIATVVDIRTRRIPNVLTATMAALGVAFAAAGSSEIPLWASGAGLAVGLSLMMPGHLLGATGAGDVKLMGAIGAIIGPAAVLHAFLFTAIAGGVLALVVAVRRRRLVATLAVTGRLIAGSPAAHEEIRSAPVTRRFAYGPAIAAGSIAALLVG